MRTEQELCHVEGYTDWLDHDLRIDEQARGMALPSVEESGGSTDYLTDDNSYNEDDAQ